MMRWLETVVLILIIAVVGVHIKDTYFPTPCREPIAYNIGNFDTQFNVSKEYFLKAISDAEAVWEAPYGRQLFEYKPSAKNALNVNLVYDYRQAATKNLKTLGIEVKETQASYDALKSKLASMMKDFEKRKAEFEARLAQWNKSPMTNREEFEALQAMQTDVNRRVDEINSVVVTINRLAQKLNITVDKYNTVSVSRGESFEEGVYYMEGGERGIDIYEFENRDKLLRVLAHELGHALGMAHIKDSKAIMYEFNQGSAHVATDADLLELKRVCGV